MTPVLWLVLGGVSVAIVAVLARRRSFQRIQDMGDTEFVRRYKKAFDGDDASIIRERKFVATALGVPHLKLHPNHRFKDLSNLHFDVGYAVAMGDLENDLIDLRQRAGIDSGSHFPDTVEELVSILVALRTKIEDKA